jgi:hypothetical protein
VQDRRRFIGSILVAALALATMATLPALSRADVSAALHVGLVPERLGHGTTIKFGFDLAESHGGVPAPVTAVSLFYPRNFGILSSGLGLASCTSTVLEARGARGCPSRSLMGFGTATGAIQVGDERVDEQALTAVYLAPFQNGNVTLLFFLKAYMPLFAERIFDGFLQPAPAPFGGALTINVPLIESFPEGPYVALVKLRSTIGPLGITYYARTHGQFVPYRPSGIILPPKCPIDGFPFAARFTFADGHELTVTKKVRCPRAHH